MTWTSHGHYIPGTTTLGQGKQPPVARCGGVRLCVKCIKEAVNVGWKPDSAAGEKVKEIYEMVKDEAITVRDETPKDQPPLFETDRRTDETPKDQPPHTETVLRTDETVVREYLTNLLNVKNREYEDLIREDFVDHAYEVLLEIHNLHRMLAGLIRHGVWFYA